ncbi:MAG: sel1 repeat family protein [Pseudobutyrivibrio sp.]|nr:sel1 repeat family protein [Pseudobutyrivibrio sp.]
MKPNNFAFSLSIILAASLLTACGDSDKSTHVETTPENTQEIVTDTIKDYNQLTYDELEVLAYEGDLQAQVALATMLEYGNDDVKQDFQEAFDWYQMASDVGNVDATCALGYFYLTGTYVDKDLDKANECFTLALEGGSVNANVGLGRVILETLTDEDMAKYSIPPKVQVLETEETEEGQDAGQEESAEESIGDASVIEEAIPENEQTSNENIVDFEHLSPEDLEELAEDPIYLSIGQCFEYFTTAATAGDLDGTYYMGYMYEHGLGCQGSYETALEFYNAASYSDSTLLSDQLAINMSDNAIGVLNVKGYLAESSTESALEHFKKASDNGYPRSSYYLGQIYEKGIGVDKDYQKALEYYLLAADYRFAPALNQMGYMYYNGLGVNVDFATAVYYQKMAALQGYTPAQVNLGFLYENGYGVERNLETALEYYEMASEKGFEGAEEAVTRVRAQINEEES